MSVNLYDTRTILAATEVIKPQNTFLRDRYFPTTEADIFETEKVDIDFMDEQANALAPVVLPYKGGIPVARAGYETHEITPPLIAPERPLTAQQLMKRQAGENVVGGLTPEQREAVYINRDIRDLDKLIANREEMMAASVLVNNKISMNQYADSYGDTSKAVPFDVAYYSGDSNPSVYTPASSWTAASTTILSDILAMIKMQTSRGVAATDVILGDSAADVFMKNSEVQSLLDNRRIELGSINPEMYPEGAAKIATLNIRGNKVDVFCYSRQYVGEDGSTLTSFIPVNSVVVTAPGLGRTAYGAITQLEENVKDFVTYRGRRIPHVVTDSKSNTRSFIEQARAITIPRIKNMAVSATVL